MNIGIHVTKSSIIIGQSDTLKNAINKSFDILNTNISQIYTHGPRTRNINKIDGVINTNKLYVHGSYMVNNIWKEFSEKNK